MSQYTYTIDGSENLVQIDNSTGSATGNFGISMFRGGFGEHAVDGDGNVYFQDDDDSTWHKYDDTGTEVWAQQTNQRFHDDDALITDVGSNGSLFIGDSGNRITQLDASDGSIINETTTNVLNTTDFDVSRDGSILVVGTGSDGVVQTRNTSDLSEIQQVSVGGRSNGVAVLSNNNVAVASNDGNAYIFDNPTDMNQINSFSIGSNDGDIASGPGYAIAITDNGFVEFDEDGNTTNYKSVTGASGNGGFSVSPQYEAVFSGFDGTNDVVEAYDTRDQSLIWSLTGHFQGKGYPSNSARQSNDWAPATEEERIRVGTTDSVDEFDVNGDKYEGYSTDNEIDYIQRLPGGDFITGRTNGSIIKRYDSDFNEVWSTTVSDSARGFIVGGDGYTYVCDDGTIEKLDNTDGSSVWYKTGLPHSFSEAITVLSRGNHNNQIVVGDNNGDIYLYSNGSTSGDVSQLDVLTGVGSNYFRTIMEKSDGTFYADENSGEVHTLSISSNTLSEDSSFDPADVGNSLEANAIDDRDYIHIGGASGVGVYEPDGTKVWSDTSFDCRADTSTNPNHETVFGLYADNSVRVFDSSGTQTSTANVESDPNAVSAFPRVDQFPNEWITLSQVTASQPTANGTMLTASAAVPLTKISASQFTSGSTMNGTVSTFTELITATRTVSTASPTAGSVSMSLDSAQVAGSASMDAPTLEESITSTPFGAITESNDALLTKSNLSALTVDVSVSMNPTEVEGVLFLQSVQATVSASQNVGAITATSLNATQVYSVTSMNGIVLGGLEIVTASQPDVLVTENVGTTIFNPFIDATQTSVSSTQNVVSTTFNPLIDASQFTVRARDFVATTDRKTIREFGDMTQADVEPTANEATLDATANEVE